MVATTFLRRESALAIFRGTIDQKPASLAQFEKGISANLIKEGARLGFKTSGLILKPRLDRHWENSPFGQAKADFAFAGALAAVGMLINPVDTIRTMRQANEPLCKIEKGRLLSHLYKGATPNGARQFGTWLGFPTAERVWSKVIKETTL